MKIKILAIVSLILFVFSGCAENAFESILPPERDYPSAEEYTTAVVTRGDIIEKKVLSGNKKGNTLYLASSSELYKEFELNEEGTVTYEYKNDVYSVKGKLTERPENGSGAFIIEHEAVYGISDNFPGTFSVIVSEVKNCITVPKKAILIIDSENNRALVWQLDSDGILIDREITVGAKDSESYEVVSGLEEGDTVVIR